MFKEYRKEIEWGGRPLVFETGKVARQADGAVMVTYGDTKVLCTVVGEKEQKPGLDFFPLSVHYMEKAYAAGKIPGGYLKRESRPSDSETLTARLIDRPIRPLFPKDFKCETQIISACVSHDMENQADIVAMVGTSAALTISGLPFMGPIGGCRVGYIDEEYVLNPTIENMKTTDLDLIVAGTNDGVLMVESEASELSEKIMLGAVSFGHKKFQPVIEAIIEMAEVCAKEPRQLPEPVQGSDEMIALIGEKAEAGLREAYAEKDKMERQSKISACKNTVMEDLYGDSSIDQDLLEQVMSDAFKKVEKHIVRRDILKTGLRIDGRDTKTVRPIAAEVSFLPRSHGSALFTRGETQAIAVATLGTGQDEQRVDSLVGEHFEHFMLHYNFPPYSVGEAGRFGFTGRREIGHGKLAWRAINPVLPSKEDFPYTIRIVSEITESNGSSSMATVCGASLALMDAGVPLVRPVAGIAMGLIKEDSEYAVLSDILGDEDHLGDMDFKVAGTEKGITSLQMDIKITSITQAIMEDALAQANSGRMHILSEMAKSIDTSRDQVSSNAPRITAFKINKDKIREVIGPGGKMIREITENTGAKIDLDDDGTVKVAAVDEKASEAAIKWIKDLTQEPEVGAIYDGKVVKTVDFGAFVNFMGAKDGLVHISELAKERVGKTTDIVNEGDMVKVKLIGIDDRGKIKLSMKALDQKTGKEIAN
ncbi:MAG: polyribonucleotide nucleotidyltransferase [Magnetovibrio sp.]|nr:polyribonucleotide nucleotidyltransferase [Magnetovibrio sp.]|tara:strand:+ start:10440 stop:12560 length:2121 start_codon:yes stop_codon:yes gene_type:complete